VTNFLLKIAFYGAAGISTLVIAFFFLANLFGSSDPSETWVNRLIIFVSGVTAVALLVFSYRLGHGRNQWLAGLGVAVAAVVTYFVMMVGGLFLFTTVHWQ